MEYDELVLSLRTDHDKYFARDMEAADAIEELRNELSAVKVEANNYRKALEALDGVKR